MIFKFDETFWKKKMLPNLVVFFKPGSEEELVATAENAKRAGVETVVERGARENKEVTKRAAEKLSTPTDSPCSKEFKIVD